MHCASSTIHVETIHNNSTFLQYVGHKRVREETGISDSIALLHLQNLFQMTLEHVPSGFFIDKLIYTHTEQC